MIAYIIETQKLKFANISFREFDQSEPGFFVCLILIISLSPGMFT